MHLVRSRGRRSNLVARPRSASRKKKTFRRCSGSASKRRPKTRSGSTPSWWSVPLSCTSTFHRRGTMPVTRKGLGQTSFRRKLLGYRGTWRQGLHRTHEACPCRLQWTTAMVLNHGPKTNPMGRQRTYQSEQVLVALERYAIQHGRARRPSRSSARPSASVRAARSCATFRSSRMAASSGARPVRVASKSCAAPPAGRRLSRCRSLAA